MTDEMPGQTAQAGVFFYQKQARRLSYEKTGWTAIVQPPLLCWRHENENK
jgi:hypothetical protein